MLLNTVRSLQMLLPSTSLELSERRPSTPSPRSPIYFIMFSWLSVKTVGISTTYVSNSKIHTIIPTSEIHRLLHVTLSYSCNVKNRALYIVCHVFESWYVLAV